MQSAVRRPRLKPQLGRLVLTPCSWQPCFRPALTLTGPAPDAVCAGWPASLWLSPSGRLSAHRKGISKSALPYRRTPPSWLKVNPGEVTEHVCKLARKGLTPSQIGVILRDSHGIAQVAHVTGSKILRILKKNGAPRTVRATGGWSGSRSAAS